MSNQHRRPLLAFVAVALLCGFVVGNAARGQAMGALMQVVPQVVVVTRIDKLVPVAQPEVRQLPTRTGTTQTAAPASTADATTEALVPMSVKRPAYVTAVAVPKVHDPRTKQSKEPKADARHDDRPGKAAPRPSTRPTPGLGGGHDEAQDQAKAARKAAKEQAKAARHEAQEQAKAARKAAKEQAKAARHEAKEQAKAAAKVAKQEARQEAKADRVAAKKAAQKAAKAVRKAAKHAESRAKRHLGQRAAFRG